MTTTIAERLIPIVKSALIEKNKVKTFESDIEEWLVGSFVSTMGTGGASINLKPKLRQWNKTIPEVVAYIQEQGFEVDVFKGTYIDVRCSKLVNELAKS